MVRRSLTQHDDRVAELHLGVADPAIGVDFPEAARTTRAGAPQAANSTLNPSLGPVPMPTRDSLAKFRLTLLAPPCTLDGPVFGTRGKEVGSMDVATALADRIPRSYT
jgi:hypothetical protein